MDQHRLAAPYAAQSVQRMPRSHECEGQSRGLSKTQARWHATHQGRRGRCMTGETRLGNGDHIIANGKSGNALAHRYDASGALAAKWLRVVAHRERVHHIAKVEPRGVHADLDLAVSGHASPHWAQRKFVQRAVGSLLEATRRYRRNMRHMPYKACGVPVSTSGCELVLVDGRSQPCAYRRSLCGQIVLWIEVDVLAAPLGMLQRNDLRQTADRRLCELQPRR